MSSITTSGFNGNVGLPIQNRLFYAQGMWWLFYHDGSYIYYTTNTTSTCDPTAFGTATRLQNNSTDVSCIGGKEFQCISDGNYVHYVICASDSNPMYYRRGKLNANGTITWTSNQVNMSIGISQMRVTSLAFDSTGHLLVGISAGGYARVLRNAAIDGTWSSDSAYGTTGIQVSDSGHNSIYTYAKVVPLTNKKWYCMYVWATASPDGFVYGKLWNGTALVQASSEKCAEVVTSAQMRFSATSIGDDVYLVYNSTEPSNYNIRFNIRSYSTGWRATSSTLLISNAVDPAYQANPAIVANASQKKVYIAWLKAPTSTYAYYRIYDVTSNTWSPSLSITATTKSEAGFADGHYITTTNKEYNNYVVFLYPTTLASNYLVTGFSILSPSGGSMSPTGAAYGGVAFY